ncbi:DUF4105 domain-containing protein [Sedimentitalea sp. HM32M-2]|uniref:Lnb N-terminal periplasmic domain-containing protein n=1 Tax=Sedimentitalea sp. HM32M-2 TaxID=3351566 RepID=UPI00363AFA2C
MLRLFRYTAIAIVILIVMVATAWGALALWFRLPGPETWRMAVSGGFGLFGAAIVLAQFGARRIGALGLFALVFAGLLTWWLSIPPPATGNWSPDVARQVTGRIDGDLLTLTNIREFDWRSDDDYSVNWTTRRYDLSQLQSVDMFLSYWAGPAMAHFIVSFGFAEGQYLAWSVEVRREVGGGFSPIADFFKTNTLVIIASVEQDVVGVRSNVRGEDVQLFRLSVPMEMARALLREYVRDANALAAQPEFYNSISTNCTTVVLRMMDAIGNGLPLDWRLLANGYLPDYAYERGALDRRHTMAELRALGRIAPQARAVGLVSGFSQAIRAGVPVPAR